LLFISSALRISVVVIPNTGSGPTKSQPTACLADGLAVSLPGMSEWSGIQSNRTLLDMDNSFSASTGWLKLKYLTGQNAISRQPCQIFVPKFLGLYGRDPATILKFFYKIILVFSKVMAV